MAVYTLKHASFYAKARPKPSQELTSHIIEYLGQKVTPSNGQKWNLCLDVGCGSGQCTQILSPYFKSVIGSDTSENQVTEARNNVNLSNVTFVVSNRTRFLLQLILSRVQVSPAEKLQASDNSVDLVSCSQSMHWFNLDKFYAEVKRVLRPNGVLAAFGYYNIPTVTVDGKEQAGKEFTDHLRAAYSHKYITQYSIPKLKVVDNGYLDLDFPFEDFTRVEGIKSSVKFSVEDLEGYVQAWSDYHRCYAAEPESALEVLEQFKTSVQKTSKDHDVQSGAEVNLTFHNFLIMGRKA